MGNALGLELARFRKTNVISGCANDGAFWLKRLPTADSESLPTVLVAAMPRYVQNGHTRHLHYPTGDYSHLVREKILLHSSGGVTKSSRGMSSLFKMGDSKYSGAGADWTQLLTDPALVSHLGELLQVYREAAPEKRDQALLEAMRNIKGSVPVAKASGAAAAVAPKAQATAPAQPVPAPPVATDPGTTPPFEPDIFTPSWGQDRRPYTGINCFARGKRTRTNAVVPFGG